MTNKTITFRKSSTSFFYSNASLTFRCHFCRTIYLWPQNTLQFRQPLLYSSQISFPRALFLGLQTGSSRWEPDSENMVDGEAIQSAIRAILPLLRSTCDTVHCFDERALFSLFGGHFFAISSFKRTNSDI